MCCGGLGSIDFFGRWLSVWYMGWPVRAAVALLVLAEIRDPRWAIAYLLIFGVGTIAGMMLITMAIGAPFAYTRERFVPFNRGLGVASGLLSLGFGLFITFQIAITDGLFATHPHWTPH